MHDYVYRAQGHTRGKVINMIIGRYLKVQILKSQDEG